MDARTAKLDAALVQVKAKLGDLQRSATATSAAGNEMGNKYAAGALRAAGALETMARSGEVAGGATKALVGNVSQLAFAFGPQGALVGAVGVAGLALYQLFANAREESEKTRKQIQDDFKAIAKLGIGAVAEQLNEVGPKLMAARREVVEAATA